jgi:Trk K+ transport system NAD-binding subunit
MKRRVVLCGLGQVGSRVLDHLRVMGFAVVVIDTRCAPGDPRLGSARLVHGDCRQQEVLEEAGIAACDGVFILTSDDLVNISTTLMVRHLHPTVRVVVRLFNQNLLARMSRAVPNAFALSTSALAAPLLALTALTGAATGAFRVKDERRQIAELTVTEHSTLRGQPIGQVMRQHEAVVVAHLRRGSRSRLLREVESEHRLEVGDRLVVCGEPRRLAPLLESSPEQTAAHLLWAGWLRRQGRVLWRTLAEVDLAVKICGAVFAAVVLASTLIYHYTVNKSLPNGFYRTVSVMATGADMHEEELVAPWHKIFVSLLRIAGAALTGAFTAIVTNYLLRARLSGALDVGRIPERGHVVVCGLGNVGFQVVKELLHHGERVAVIERSRDNHFFATTRRLGVPVILGDATVQEVLQQAHVAAARAVVVATSNELANLEIALLVRELNLHKRIVVRLIDPFLAQTLREEANIKLALSIPVLAAPAFVAALFGDRVSSIFMVRERTLAAAEVVVQPDDSILNGRRIRAVAIDYRLLPLNVIAAPDETLQAAAMDHRLASGDRLIVLAALPDLERLLRRQPAPANCALDVLGFPPLARPRLVQLLREERGVDEAGAEAVLDQPPFPLGERWTRGQAEDLLEELAREGIKAQVRGGESG